MATREVVLEIEDLPEEVLQQVFLALGHPAHLPTVALVCRHAPPHLFSFYLFLRLQ
jgi:hypothetical protein